MKIETLIESLKKQNFPLGEYAVFGSAVMAVRGMREAPNIDVIVTNKLWEELLKDHRPDEEGFIHIGQIKISNWWFAPTRKDIPTMIAEAEMIKGLPFVKLEEVRAYKKSLNREKDINDIKLIDQFVNAMRSTNEPNALGVEDYRDLLNVFIKEVNIQLSDSILSLVLFGSASRGEATGNSDLDIFTFFDDNKMTREQVNNKLISIIHNLRKHDEYKKLAEKGIYPEIYPFLISKSQSDNSLWAFFDSTEEGIILKDSQDFGKKLIEKTKVKIANLGGRRVSLANGKKCWILFKDFSQILNQPLNI